MGRSRRTRFGLHLVAWAVGLSVFRIGLIAPQECGSVDETQVSVAIDRAANWATANLDNSGRFLYRYDRSTGTSLGGYNLVRHAGMTNSLYQLVADGDQRWLADADLSLEFLFERLVDAGSESLAVADPGREAKLGTAALTVAALMHRRQATGDTTNDDTARALGRFLVGQIEPSGAPLGFFDVRRSAPVPGRYGLFATGEAAWALALLGTEFPAERWSDEAIRIVSYVANERRANESYLLRQPDHWTAYAMAELGPEVTQNVDGVPQYAARLASDFALMSRVEPQRTGRGLQNVLRFGQALGAGVGAMGEGLANLALVADGATVVGAGPLEGRSDELAARLECTASLLVARQVGPDDVVADASREIGAWFTDDITQVDDQQHTLSALIDTRRILFADEEVPGP